MCGIYGVVDLTGRRQPKEELLHRMGDLMVHRGPNDYGHYSGKGMAFGMRRLSIIDLSGGHQPIPNEDKTVWVICNGEIYNFKEIRKDLEKRGHVFSCDSDTEVVAHLYEDEGVNLFKRLRGMFAIAIWDTKRSRLILGRDRLGKKPLYVSREPNRILFASEMKSILEVSEISRKMNPQALREYLALGYVPAPLTMLEGIEKLLPGHYWIIEDGRVQDQEYWDVPTPKIDNASEQEWVERLREKVMESVKVRLISDVPLGAFLSGGIDSSAIVAAMARMNGQAVKTYSIGFEGPDSFYNELPYARSVAKAYNTDHHEIIVRPDIGTLLPSLIWHLDEPIADSAFVTTYLVAKMARETVTVILSGVGGDELFGGYRRYLGNQLASYYNVLPSAVRTKWLPKMLGHLPQDRHSNLKNYFRYADAFVKSAAQDPASRYMSYVTLFSADAQRGLLQDDLRKSLNGNGTASKIMKHYFDTPGGLGGLNQLIYADLKTSLADDLLALTDKMTMAASIECRAPFVDHELVEMATTMPESLKIHGFTMKYLLKKAVKPWLPPEILNRKKRGFGAPMGSWIRKDLGVLVDNLLSENQIKQRGLFSWPVVQEMVGKHKAQKADYTDHLLALINLELWCRIFMDRTNQNDLTAMMAAG